MRAPWNCTVSIINVNFQIQIYSEEGMGRETMAISILTQHNSCDLTPPMCETQQNWNLAWQEGPYDSYLHRPQEQTAPLEGLESILG